MTFLPHGALSAPSRIPSPSSRSTGSRSLAQDLEGFNLVHYATLRGRFTLKDLRDFCLVALPRLGGAILPDEEFYRIEVPSRLQGYPRVERSYRNVTFDRKLAMRRRQAGLLGIGHPLVDALLTELQKEDVPGTVTCLDAGGSTGSSLRVYCLAHVAYEDGKTRRYLRTADLKPDGAWTSVDDGAEASVHMLLRDRNRPIPMTNPPGLSFDWASAYRAAISFWESELRAKEGGILAVRFVVTGIVCGVSILGSATG